MDAPSDEKHYHEGEENTPREIQDVTDLIGDCGRWQKQLFFLVFYIGIFSAFNNLNLPFLAPNTDHWCSRPPRFANTSVEKWKNQTIPPYADNENKIIDKKCEMYDENLKLNGSTANSPVISCSSWEYDHSSYKSSIIEKWNLVCDRSWLVSLSGSIYFVGFLVTAFVSGHLSDRFGRRPVFMTCVLINSVFGIICMVSPTFWMFTASRFLLSLGRAGLFITSYVLVTEMVGPEHRKSVGTFDKFGWGTGQMILPGIAWLVKDWYYVQLACTLPVIVLFSMWWYIPESPRWLLSRGRIDEAEIVLRKAMKVNGLPTDKLSGLLQKVAYNIQIEDRDMQKKSFSFLDVLKNLHMLKLTLALYFIWIVNVFAFYGLSFNAQDTGGNVYLFYFLSGVMDYPSALFMHYFLNRIGRRYPLMLCFIITGLACLLATAVPGDMTWLRITLAVLSKFCLSTAISTLYILSSEIYPTVVRNVGVGSCSMMGRIGAIIAPFMKQASEKVHWALPFSIFGIMCIAAGLMTLVLPETKSIRLADCLLEERKKGNTANDDFILNSLLSETKEVIVSQPVITSKKQTMV